MGYTWSQLESCGNACAAAYISIVVSGVQAVASVLPWVGGRRNRTKAL